MVLETAVSSFACSVEHKFHSLGESESLQAEVEKTQKVEWPAAMPNMGLLAGNIVHARNSWEQGLRI